MQRSFTKTSVTPDSLLGIRFFDDLDRAERARIALLCEGRTYRPNAEIVRHLDTSGDVFFIQTGRVEATMLTTTGKVVNFQLLSNGEMFGEVAAIDSRPRITSVLAVEESTVIRMSASSFCELLERNPRLAKRTMRRLCDLARHLCEKAYEPRAYSVPDQIRLEIHREVRRQGHWQGRTVIKPAPTHKDIGARVGTTREQVTRVIQELAQEGLLRQDGRAWVIEDVAALRNHLETRLQPIEC